MPDDGLIRRFQEGDAPAFNFLVKRWEKSIYNFVLRTMGEREEARDICQKTFIQAYKSLNRLREPAKFSPWLYQIAANLCRGAHRRKKRHPSVSIEDLTGESQGLGEPFMFADNPEARPDSMAERSRVREILNAAL